MLFALDLAIKTGAMVLRIKVDLSRQIRTCSVELEVVWDRYGYGVAILKWQNLQSFHYY